jgi:hypothetical protein
MQRLVTLLWAVSFYGQFVQAQDVRGTIAGLVLDPTSAAVVSARVTVANVDTGAAVQILTNSTGYYEATLLLAGNYRITAEAEGFKRSVREGIELRVAARLEVNLALELGSLTEAVTVTAAASMLDTTMVTSGRVMENRDLMDLPVIGNNVMLLANFTPGVQTNGRTVNAPLGSGIDTPHLPGNVGGNEYTLDGAPNNGGGRSLSYLPYSDAIQEFRTETSNFDASFGHAAGMGMTVMTKSGANSYHGTVTHQHYQQRWNGTPFFTRQLYYRRVAEAESAGDMALAEQRRSEERQQAGRSNNYALTLSGPVTIPKIVNGRDRLFFFFSYNGLRESKSDLPNNINNTIPTMKNRVGDFSDWLEVDSKYQVHDPLSVRPDPARPGHFVRTPFAGNLVPKARAINPIYDRYIGFFPVPNNEPLNPKEDHVNNYLSTRMPWIWDTDGLSTRIDYNYSARHRFFLHWHRTAFVEEREDWTYETAPGMNTRYNDRQTHGGNLDWVWAPNSSTVFDFLVGAAYTRGGIIIKETRQYKPTDFGLPAYMDEKAGADHVLPQMDYAGGYRSVSENHTGSLTHHHSFTGKTDVSHIRGRHTLRAGFDGRGQFRNGGSKGYTSGRFAFQNVFVARDDDFNAPTASLGLAWAAFYMGYPTTMKVDTNDTYATANHYYSWYVQDSWRATPDLTLTFGLRFEQDLGPTERYNRAIGGFDAEASLPISEAAEAAYERNPLPELSASTFRVRGGSWFPGVGGRSRRLVGNELMLLPRLGAAWKLNSNTVVRGGYGIFYDTINVMDRQFGSPTIGGTIGNGFSRTTNTNASNDFGMTWLAGDPANGISPLIDPFPIRADGTRFDIPPRHALGLMTVAGRNFPFIPFDSRHPRVQRWRLGIQRQIGANMVLDVAYVGSYGDRIWLTKNLRPLPENYWADGLARDAARASDLNRNVANPFYIDNFSNLAASDPLLYTEMLTAPLFTSRTIQKHQLLRDFPHMTLLTDGTADDGKMRSHSLEVMFQRRFSRGFNFTVGYTALRMREADVYLDEFDSRPTWHESIDGRPHRFTATGLWELPFGRGRAFATQGVLSRLFGGFQVGVTYEFQPGPLLNFGNLFYYGDLSNIKLENPTLDRWFNTDDFERASARQPAAFHRRVFPLTVSGLRSDMTNQWNSNVMREFMIREGTRLQFRVDVLNLANRSVFAAPNTNPTNTNFGRVTSQINNINRFIQLQARIRF